MSLIAARKKRTSLYLSVAGLLVMVAAVSAISASDPAGVLLRVGMIMIVAGAALWLPWQLLIPAALLAWLAPNLGRSLVDDATVGNLSMMLELPGLAGVGFFTWMARDSLKRLEQENVLIGTGNSDLAGMNPETGIFDENQLRPALSVELARSRRFGRTFSLVLVGIDEMRQKFDYRDEALSKASLHATTELLRQTRHNVDRVFHYKGGGFAIILPESSDKDIPGLVKRLRRLASTMKPAEGEPGGPMPVHFGATFFPDCATTVEDLLRRAEIALRIANASTTRYQLDSAAAPELPPVESLRRENVVSITAANRLREETAPALPSPVTAASAQQLSAEQTPDAEAYAGPTAVDFGHNTALKAAHAPAQEPLDVPAAAVAHIGEPRPQPLEAPSASAATLPEDDFEALLAQMDETLKMIRTVREHAA